MDTFDATSLYQSKFDSPTRHRPARLSNVASIGTANMEPDGTITLSLQADGGAGTVGHSTISYPPNDPYYRDVLAHVGGLLPGESKGLPPWK
jgi:hypothetical protein